MSALRIGGKEMLEFQTGVGIKAWRWRLPVSPQGKHKGLADLTRDGDVLDAPATTQLTGCAWQVTPHATQCSVSSSSGLQWVVHRTTCFSLV